MKCTSICILFHQYLITSLINVYTNGNTIKLFFLFHSKSAKMFVVCVTKLTVVSSNNIYMYMYLKKNTFRNHRVSLAVCTGHILTSFFPLSDFKRRQECRTCVFMYIFLLCQMNHKLYTHKCLINSNIIYHLSCFYDH